MVKCEYCNSEFIRITNKKFCSRLCRSRAKHDREHPGRGRTTLPRECLECGEPISSTDYRGRIYCSRVCKSRAVKSRVASESETLLTLVSIIKEHMSDSEEAVTRYVKGVPILMDSRVASCLAPYNMFVTKGYACISYKGVTLRLHRLVFLLLKGVISTPGSPIDHINQNKLDNRIDNLRLTTPGKNLANRKLKPNKSGYRGVYPHLDKWIAQVCISGKVKALGRFNTKEEAALAYNQAALEIWGQDAEINELVI